MGLRVHMTPCVQIDRMVHILRTILAGTVAGTAGRVCTVKGGTVTIGTITTVIGMRGEEYARFLPRHDTVREGVVATIIVVPEFAGITFVANAELNPSGLRRKS